MENGVVTNYLYALKLPVDNYWYCKYHVKDIQQTSNEAVKMHMGL